MGLVKELNELAQKMTGTKGEAKTTAEALDYIEQNYTGGEGGSKKWTIQVNEVASYSGETISADITDKERKDIIDDIETNWKEGDLIYFKITPTEGINMNFLATNISITAMGTTIDSLIHLGGVADLNITKMGESYFVTIQPAS